MQVTLKRASEYARSLGDAANKIPFLQKATVSLHSNEAADITLLGNAVTGGDALKATIEAGQKNLGDDHRRALALLQAQYGIRSAISHHNQSSGISDALTERALLDQKIKKLEAFLATVSGARADTVETVGRQIVQKRERSKDTASRSYLDRDDSVTINLMTPELEAEIKADLSAARRARLDVQDRLSALNMNVKIELPETTVTLLKDHGIVA
jgi:hypothetical protein